MIHALQLVGKVLLGKLPPRALWWVVANKFNNILETGNQQYEFELLYLEHPDPWKYLCSVYERGKYDHALACTLKWRRASDYVLEIGCSIGVFSKMLAVHFNQVTAIDVSSEALRAAAYYNRSSGNIRFVQGDLRSVKPDRQYDVIICGEILYYITQKHAQRVCEQLNKFLAPHGVIVTVTGIGNGESDDWNHILSHQFAVICRERVERGVGSYEIVIFSSQLNHFSRLAAEPNSRNLWAESLSAGLRRPKRRRRSAGPMPLGTLDTSESLNAISRDIIL
jgi:2-polyprenyl-3-methyl-5-hydroxy-6-metoxy-1,4-benzoquinol methylase